MENSHDKFLTILEVARRLRVAPRTILNALSRRRRGLSAGPFGELPVVRFGRRLLVPADAFDRWLSEHLRPAAEPVAIRGRLEVWS